MGQAALRYSGPRGPGRTALQSGLKLLALITGPSGGPSGGVPHPASPEPFRVAPFAPLLQEAFPDLGEQALVFLSSICSLLVP